ncbi:calmodulin-binding-domain-containing protein [Polychytrium aggregatum]|uniref:calmodulin-binding-domain-containing protein n=1 Tax=Polychytrium aggregatum TaxID=110093 RepID=UPI0022FE4176|nr:calmodulin-binding-domain-containing protein [Polychytrium aggregatum]KAI9193173.1 calmodulin-binding-domain-containing protein [Polychytrium aggregatum]
MSDSGADRPNTIITTHPVPPDPFEESVYGLIPVEYEPPPKQDMYRSKFASQARKEYWNGLKASASMGPAKVGVNDPRDYLRKGEREKHNNPAKVYQPDRMIRKAPLPDEAGKLATPTSKNFVVQNALENINSDAKKNHITPPSYKSKKDYGRVPNYLVDRKKEQESIRQRQLEEEELELQKQQGQQQLHQYQQANGGGVVPLPDEERLKILEGLKLNWEKLNSDYQKLSLTVDTVPKIARKVNMEQQLKNLEAHIAKFSSSNIYVNFDSVYSR